MVTAVATCTDGVRIGYPAIDTDRAVIRYAGFKSPHLHLPSVSDPVRHFVSAVRDEVRSEGYLPADRSTTWVFGAPSGWDSMTVEAFRDLLAELGLGDIEVIRESRAAMRGGTATQAWLAAAAPGADSAAMSVAACWLAALSAAGVPATIVMLSRRSSASS